MSANTQMVVERIRERLRMGEVTSAQANVEMVLAERVRVVKGRVPSDVRRALNEAVSAGVLGHFKKDGFKPEIYFHPTFEYLAKGERAAVERAAKEAVAKVAGWPA